jgi:hypothetical protein
MYHRALNKNGEFLSGAMEMEKMRSAGRRGAAGQSLCEGPFSVSCRKSKPFKPSDAVGFDEKSLYLAPIVIDHRQHDDGVFFAAGFLVNRSDCAL